MHKLPPCPLAEGYPARGSKAHPVSWSRSQVRVERNSPMTHTTLNMKRDQSLFPSLHLLYVVRGDDVITFWYDDDRVVQRWHTTDWDRCGWSVVKVVSEENSLSW